MIIVFAFSCDMIQLIGKRCSFLKHAQEDGVHVAVMHLLQPGAVVLLHVKDLAVLTRCTLYDSNNNTASTSSPTVSQPYVYIDFEAFFKNLAIHCVIIDCYHEGHPLHYVMGRTF